MGGTLKLKVYKTFKKTSTKDRIYFVSKNEELNRLMSQIKNITIIPNYELAREEIKKGIIIVSPNSNYDLQAKAFIKDMSENNKVLVCCSKGHFLGKNIKIFRSINSILQYLNIDEKIVTNKYELIEKLNEQGIETLIVNTGGNKKADIDLNKLKERTFFGKEIVLYCEDSLLKKELFRLLKPKAQGVFATSSLREALNYAEINKDNKLVIITNN